MGITVGSTGRGQCKSASIEAVVLNADGTVKKRLGVVASYHRNPLINAWQNVRLRLRNLFK